MTTLHRGSLLAVMATAVCLLLGALGPAAAAGGGRIALVVGNSAYHSVGQLANPGNDAKLMARSLKASGFTLIGGDAQLNLDKAHFDQAVARFGQAIATAEVALFYYSGHGLQVDGTNYLVPVDANPTRTQDLDFQMVSADLVLRQMSGSTTKLNIMILDACRNNPFGGRGLRSAGGGLAEMRAPEGTLISYATQPGAVASDGAGRDSPFTLALVEAMKQPGLDIFRLFNRVGLDVKKSTDGQQQPWLSASPIEGEFAFAPGSGAPPAAPPPLAPPPAQAPAQTAALMPPAQTPAQMRQQSPAEPERPAGAGFRCPPKGTVVSAEEETFDWKGEALTIRAVTGTSSWRALGPDPGNPAVCLHIGRSGVAHRLAGWFDLDQYSYEDDPGAPMLALLAGQTREITTRATRKDTVINTGIPVVFTHVWRLHGHESLSIGGRSYDTLVFDQRGSSTKNSFTGEGRAWFAPALGLFVRKIWRASNSDDVVGWTVTSVASGG